MLSYNPLISIVVPTFNQKIFVESTINSIINQSYKNIEIIISDDCSTDGTKDTLINLSRNESRIKLLTSAENKGIPNNFNKAFDACTGEYVAFLGGDDLMYPFKIEKQLEFLLANPAYVLCYHDMDLYYQNEEKKIKHSSKIEIISNPLEWVFYSNWIFVKNPTGIIPSACLAKREYYLHSRYDTRLKYKHELLFTLDDYCHDPSGKWGFINETLGMYRIHDSNFSLDIKNTNLIQEETELLCTISIARYPYLAKTIINHRNYFWFHQLLFNFVTPESKQHFLRMFRIEAGLLKYTYLQFCRLLFKMNILFHFFKPIKYLYSII